jgi:hypothetical protein
MKATMFYIKLILTTLITSHNSRQNQTTKKDVTQPSISHSIPSSHNHNLFPCLISYVYPLNLTRNNIHEKRMGNNEHEERSRNKRRNPQGLTPQVTHTSSLLTF